MEIEIDTAIPNSKEEDLEIETDGKDGVTFQDQNPKKDIKVIEIAVETGKGTIVEIGEIKLLGEEKERTEIENTDIETEKKERVEIEEKERAEIENTEEEKKKERKAR